ncbi:protein-tyrosine-phosphatase [Ignavibacteriales bacterium]
MNIYPKIEQTLLVVKSAGKNIPSERVDLLNKFAQYIADKRIKGLPVNLIFICTHNSRRSHLSQIWAQFFAGFYGLQEVYCFSGGTEATAFNPRAVKCLKNQGFKITAGGDQTNPLYSVSFSDEYQPINCFSKVYDHHENPQKDFAAVMTCSDADEACPFIPGAEKRFPVRYEDPKKFDDTPLEEEKYSERSIQIASEMDYLFSKSAAIISGKL